MTDAGRRPVGPRLFAQLGIAALIVFAVALTVHLWGAELSHWVREQVLRFRPVTALRTASVVAVVAAALRLISTKTNGRVALAFGRRMARRWLGPLARVPAVVALTGIVMLAAGLRTLLVRPETEPKVFGDEVLYTELAKNIALHGRPLLRGHLELGYSVLYPLFLSPAYRLASDGAAAFAAAKTMNAVAMAVTAIPAYALARRVLSHGWSLGVAALVVLEPWVAYASFTMTESLFLPSFTAFALVLVRMLERPTAGRQVLVLITLTFLVGIRPQALVLTASVVAAIALKGLLAGSVRRVVSEHCCAGVPRPGPLRRLDRADRRHLASGRLGAALADSRLQPAGPGEVDALEPRCLRNCPWGDHTRGIPAGPPRAPKPFRIGWRPRTRDRGANADYGSVAISKRPLRQSIRLRHLA
jgi:hypothetical protein